MEKEITATTFAYEEIDPETRISLKQRAGRIGERTRRMATDIWENGREFAEAQQELASYGNGRFLAWVEAETGYSKSTVYRMIEVHQRLDFPKLGKTDIVASALYLLASASTPEAAREEVMSAAERGEAISHGRAKEIVQAHKPRPSTDDMRKRLRQSLRDEMYATYQVTGITDADLRQVLSRDWGLGGGSSGPDRTAVYKKGGANPGFWYNSYRDSGAPTLSGRL